MTDLLKVTVFRRFYKKITENNYTSEKGELNNHELDRLQLKYLAESKLPAAENHFQMKAIITSPQSKKGYCFKRIK